MACHFAHGANRKQENISVLKEVLIKEALISANCFLPVKNRYGVEKQAQTERIIHANTIILRIYTEKLMKKVDK